MSTGQNGGSSRQGGGPVEMYTPAPTTSGASASAPGPTSWAAKVGDSIRQSFGRFQRHDSVFSVSSEYEYSSPNDLNLWQGAALLTADCLGTGILALPHDIKILGAWLGIGFLLLNLPINLFAGTILSDAAGFVERRQVAENQRFATVQVGPPPSQEESLTKETGENDNGDVTNDDDEVLSNESPLQDQKRHRGKNYKTISSTGADGEAPYVDADSFCDEQQHHDLHHDTATFDFIGMTSALFNSPQATRCIMILFYTNIFLVLGNYILVMSHAVAALLGESWLCIPQAGLFASTLMFAVSQLRTMANLGRTASVVSLSALLVVIVQCLYFANYGEQNQNVQEVDEDDEEEDFSIFRKLTAIGSIGFAVGSQKLFLNIRHELADRESAPKTLAISLTAFGAFYVGVVLCAGNNPPGFLFDAIPQGLNRHIAGFFLWVHVVVSYAINSQAICASMDRIFFYQWGPVSGLQDHQRWMILTGIMALSAFFVANAIPFFKDLVAFIGALTSVPLTLLLPAVFHRKVLGVSILCPTLSSLTSYGLLVFSALFMFAALVGAVDSIFSDWRDHSGGFFSCR